VLKAEQYCLGCHVKAQVGEVLGTVTVRSYLARKEAVWWEEVRVTAAALSLKILIHTVVLLLLLRVRMAPLMTLRSTAATLAKGVMDLSPRARVSSEDEFGELAQDLNHFLDRITLVVHDLDRILSEVVRVGERLGPWPTAPSAALRPGWRLRARWVPSTCCTASSTRRWWSVRCGPTKPSACARRWPGWVSASSP
jgi:HAMP domain-containing protein